MEVDQIALGCSDGWPRGSGAAPDERWGGRRGQVSSSLLGPSFRALSGRLKFTVRRHKFNTYSLSGAAG